MSVSVEWCCVKSKERDEKQQTKKSNSVLVTLLVRKMIETKSSKTSTAAPASQPGHPRVFPVLYNGNLGLNPGSKVFEPLNRYSNGPRARFYLQSRITVTLRSKSCSIFGLAYYILVVPPLRATQANSWCVLFRW